MIKKERQQKETKEKYQWLDPSDERKYMTDREILEKYIYLETCFMDKEKKEVMDMLYKYKEAFCFKRWNRYLSKHRGRNWHDRQISILY